MSPSIAPYLMLLQSEEDVAGMLGAGFGCVFFWDAPNF